MDNFGEVIANYLTDNSASSEEVSKKLKEILNKKQQQK
jgi:hypothetical protein